MRGRLAELQIDKVAALKDIPKKQLGEGDIAGDSRAQLRRELGGILERCGSGRSEEADQKKRPLANSYEWVGGGSNRATNADGRNAKWQNRKTESTEEQWSWLVTLILFARRRPVMGSAGDLWG